ncbi:hypothetical protein ABHI18_003949 [Aspergillus niger]
MGPSRSRNSGSVMTCSLVRNLSWSQEVRAGKINLGHGFYGRSFTLTDPSCTAAGCPFSSGGNPGNCSASPGTLMDSEILAIIADGGTTSVLDKDAAVNVVTWDTDQWVSYDDETTIKMKKYYANGKCLGGTNASQELLEMNGLIKKSLFGGQTPQVSSLSQYVWGGCDEDCPSGTTHATNRKGKSASNVAIYSGCFNGQKRNYCCPTDDVPTCQWFSKARLSYAVAIPAQREKFKSQPINMPRAIAVGSTISPCAVLRPHPMQQLDSTNGQALHQTVQVVTIMPVVLRAILRPKLHSEEFRELLWSIGNATGEDSEGIFGGLFPRARKSKICQSKKTISTFKAKNYPNVGTLAATRQFYGVVKSGAKTAICNELPITLGKRILGTNYVVEHVTELQTPAQFATSMLSEKLPSAAAAPGAASNYDWTQVFSQNGYFFQTWAQLGVTRPTSLTGDSPAEAIANALGSTADISNLQILDAPTNGLEAAAWQLFDNIISPKRFGGESVEGKVNMMNRLYDTLPGYMNSADVQGSLKYGYKAIKAAMGALDQAAQNNPNVDGITASSFEDAWMAYSKDFFEQMQGNLQDFVTARINEVTKYWSSSAATKAFTKAAAAAVANSLGEKLSGVSMDVVIDSTFVQ